MTIYIDVFFLYNFLFDFLIIVIASRLGGVKFSIIRFLSAAILGAILCCAALFFPIMSTLFAKIMVIALMSFAAFGFRCGSIFLKQTLILFMGFFICGGATGILPYMGFGKILNRIYFFDIPVMPVLLSVIATASGVFIISGRIRAIKGRTFAEIAVFKDGKKYHLTALYDSGNLCTDSLSGLPVIVAENVFHGVPAKENFFSTASGYGTLRVFLPDSVEVLFEGKCFEGKDVAIGIVDRKLSREGRFNALIGGICFERLVGKDKKAVYRA